MKFRKLVFECGIIAASAVIISGSSAVSVSAAETATGTVSTGSEQDETENSNSKEKNGASDTDTQEINGEVTDSEASEDQVSDEDAADEKTSEGTEEETSEWSNKLLVIVDKDSSLNVREEANTDSEVVGKMYRGSAAEVVETGEEWTKIVSGDVEGYVKNEFCVFAEEAEAQAEEICDTTATVKTDGVRLRSESNTDSTIYRILSEGDSLTATESDEETADEWIAVEYGDEVAYVSADYVEVELEVGEAVSMEEIYEQQAAEAAKKAEEAAAASTGSSSGSSTSSSGTAVSASSDDTMLLAALIQCEAGGESYAGQLAVGAVVMNRVKSGSFPNSISGVIYQSGQFSPASSGKLSRVLSSGSISSSCYQAAQAAIAGEDNTGGAKYFHAGSGSGTVIGNQVFY